MTVSVIIPVRNHADTLKRAVESAFFVAHAQVVIVYDASEDATFDVACELARQPDVSLIHPKSATPVGVCAARNIGITQARTEWIVPLDADDYFLPGGLQALLDAWTPGTWVYGAYEDDHGAIIQPPPPGMLPKKNVTQATMLFTKSDWLRVGGYNPAFNVGAEDYAFTRALVRAGIRGTQIEQPVYHYTDNPTGRAVACQRRWPLIKTLLEEECRL